MLSILLTFFIHFMIFCVLPTLSLYVITRNVHQLEEPSLRECIGEMYEGTRIDSIYQRAYNLVFMTRRFIYLTIAVFIQDNKKGGIQIILILYLNLVTSIYIVSTKSQPKRILNNIEILNEYFVYISTSIMILFTDFVPDFDLQFTFGWYFIALTVLIFIYNFIFIVREMLYILYVYGRLCYNHLNKFYGRII